MDVAVVIFMCHVVCKNFSHCNTILLILMYAYLHIL